MIVEVDAPGPPRLAYAYTGGVRHGAGGEGTPALVFIHGAMHDHSVWTLCARWFAHHGRRAYAVDLPGHGRSGGPPLASVEAMAGWLVAFLRAVRAGPAWLVGHSMGSLVALEAAALAPDAMEGLVMVGTAYPMKVSPALLQMARDDPAGAIAQVDAWSHSTLAAKPSYPAPGAWLRGANRALMHRMQGLGARHGNLFEIDFRACDAYAQGLEAAGRVRCPTHFVLGTRDAMTPARASVELGQALRASAHRVEAGHALMQEAPDAVLAALRAAIGV